MCVELVGVQCIFIFVIILPFLAASIFIYFHSFVAAPPFFLSEQQCFPTQHFSLFASALTQEEEREKRVTGKGNRNG